MFDAQAVTRAQFDQAALAYEVSGNDLKSAREAYNRTKDQLRVELKNAQSNVATSGLDYSNYTIKSMIDGIVYDTYKDLGEAVRRTELVALVGEKGAKILELSVDQSDIGKIKVGQEVVVKMDVSGAKVFNAKVSKIYPNMNQNDQSFKVEAEFTENYDLNFVHASVEANIIIAKKDNALIIPKNVVQANDEVEIKGTGMNNMVKIKKGLENLEFVEVTEGVKEGDEIVMPKAK
jgi:multidrug resistance efflux pump